MQPALLYVNIVHKMDAILASKAISIIKQAAILTQSQIVLYIIGEYA